MALMAAAVPSSGQGNPSITIAGMVRDSAGAPVAGATMRLERTGLTATSGPDGRYTLTNGTAVGSEASQERFAAIHEGSLFLSLPEKSSVTITAFGVEGQALASVRRHLQAGSHGLPLPGVGSGVRFFRVKAGARETVVHALAVDGVLRGGALGLSFPGLAKAGAAEPLYDVIMATKAGYLKSYLSVSSSQASSADIRLLKEGSAKFSFFVTSMKAMLDLAKSEKGFGGDLRYGETGPGAGLRGADRICAAVADRSMPGSSFKGWRAFLSVTADAYGNKVDAIDRVGEGPWYDRLGRLLAPKKSDLVNIRPQNGHPAIRDDLPNEDGVPNHRPDPTKPAIDNHHTVTGSTTTGTLKGANATCKDWTTSSTDRTSTGKPSCGFSWPRGGSGASGNHWMSTFDCSGCAAGTDFSSVPPPEMVIIGGGGGYGGFYCFALNP